MKCFYFILFFVVSSNLFAQTLLTTENQDLIHIGSKEIKKEFIPVSDYTHLLKSAEESKSRFNVRFVNFPDEAKNAFLYAVSIWENSISSPVPVNVIARWDTLDNMVLAKCRPTAISSSFEGAPIKDVYYPVALVEKIIGKDTNDTLPDITCTFNANMPWYFGTNGNTPETKYDLTTVVLHEIAHGLGIFGFLNDNNGVGFLNNATNIPSVYDYFLFNDQDQQISDKSIFTCPSEDLHLQLTSEKLKFYNFKINLETERTINRIYAPRIFKAGLSFYHMNQINSEPQLMGPYTYRGEAVHKIDDKILKILAAIGWNAVTFDFQEPKVIDQSSDEVPFAISFDGLLPGDTNRIEMVYSIDQFLSEDTAKMYLNNSTQKYECKVPTNRINGNFQYYFILNTADEESYFWPDSAPGKTFALTIGNDFSPPVIKHNPVGIIYPSTPYLTISAFVDDNVSVENVKVEFKLNGILQNDVILWNDFSDHYSGQISIDKDLLKSGKLEYRIVAIDGSEQSNTKTAPATGFYSVSVYEPYKPVSAYYSDFDEEQDDFILTDFSVSNQEGFNSNALNSPHPYKKSITEDEYYNHIAQLKYPVILNEDGNMSFDEVVLIEPGEIGTKSTSPLFKDFAIVEGSKDNGKTWLPITEGYDAQLNKSWLESYVASSDSENMENMVQQSLFLKHNISLTENPNFRSGDTILVRFRLASDQSTSGWGWAIDNLKIQNETTDASSVLVQKDINVFPNPCKNKINIELSAFSDASSFTIHVFDLLGKTVYLHNFENSFHSNHESIDLSKVSPGIYQVTITDKNRNRLTKKIVKL